SHFIPSTMARNIAVEPLSLKPARFDKPLHKSQRVHGSSVTGSSPERGSRRPSWRNPMTQVEILDAARGRDGGYKVDVNRGQRVGRVSSEWFSRPADERFVSLSDLFAAVRGRTERSRTRTLESATIRVEANRDDAERLTLVLPGS